ncbi:hypothetical protein F5141DRAFT_1250508 [Pisolithus sp. B1]|nr:hypothetical protein F5141DRAFT_1250508 [Pisolithus sp. B1]
MLSRTLLAWVFDYLRSWSSVTHYLSIEVQQAAKCEVDDALRTLKDSKEESEESESSDSPNRSRKGERRNRNGSPSTEELDYAKRQLQSAKSTQALGNNIQASQTLPGQATLLVLTNGARWEPFISVITLIRLWGFDTGRKGKMLVNYIHLVTAIHWANMHTTSKFAADEYMFHIAFTSATCSWRLVPVHSWRTWAFERYNYMLQNIKSNNKFGELELTFMNDACRAANLTAYMFGGRQRGGKQHKTKVMYLLLCVTFEHRTHQMSFSVQKYGGRACVTKRTYAPPEMLTLSYWASGDSSCNDGCEPARILALFCDRRKLERNNLDLQHFAKTHFDRFDDRLPVEVVHVLPIFRNIHFDDVDTEILDNNHGEEEGKILEDVLLLFLLLLSSLCTHREWFEVIPTVLGFPISWPYVRLVKTASIRTSLPAACVGTAVNALCPRQSFCVRWTEILEMSGPSLQIGQNGDPTLELCGTWSIMKRVPTMVEFGRRNHQSMRTRVQEKAQVMSTTNDQREDSSILAVTFATDIAEGVGKTVKALAPNSRKSEVALFSEDEIIGLGATCTWMCVLAGSHDLTSWMEEDEGGKQSSMWDIISALVEHGRLGYKEDERMIEQACWKLGMRRQIATSSCETLREQQDSLLERLVEYAVGTQSSTVEGVKRAAVSNPHEFVYSVLPDTGLSQRMDNGFQRRYLPFNSMMKCNIVAQGSSRPRSSNMQNYLKMTGHLRNQQKGMIALIARKMYVPVKNVKGKGPSKTQVENTSRTKSTYLKGVPRTGVSVRSDCLAISSSYPVRVPCMSGMVQYFWHITGRLGPVFDICTKVIVDVLREECMYNNNGEVVVDIVTQALKEYGRLVVIPTWYINLFFSGYAFTSAYSNEALRTKS